MSARKATVAGWVALVLGILFVLLQSYGWWDEVQARDGQGDWLEQWAITTHVLPTLLLIASVALGWRWPLVGLAPGPAGTQSGWHLVGLALSPAGT